MALTSDDIETITRLIRSEHAQLRAELDRVDDWANGVFLALQDLLPSLLKAHPDTAAAVADMWRKAAEQYDQVAAGHAVTDVDGDPVTLEFLEARKMLYRSLGHLSGIWPEPK